MQMIILFTMALTIQFCWQWQWQWQRLQYQPRQSYKCLSRKMIRCQVHFSASPICNRHLYFGAYINTTLSVFNRDTCHTYISKFFFLTLSITISVFNRLTKSKITFTVMGNKVYFLVQITRKSGHRCASLTCITWISCITCITCYHRNISPSNFMRYLWYSRDNCITKLSHWKSLVIIDYRWLSLIVIDWLLGWGPKLKNHPIFI